tara:strand:+ start:1695 stop:2231 length:537 start_codon:yes stop_codon:yes gene_type:complete
MFFTFLLRQKSALLKKRKSKLLIRFAVFLVAILGLAHFFLNQHLQQEAEHQHQARVELKALPDVTTLTQAQQQHRLLKTRLQQVHHLQIEQNVPIQILHTLLYQQHDAVQLDTLNLSKTELFLTGHVMSHSALEQWITQLETSALLVSPHIVSIQMDNTATPSRYQFQLHFNVHLSKS